MINLKNYVNKGWFKLIWIFWGIKGLRIRFDISVIINVC